MNNRNELIRKVIETYPKEKLTFQKSKEDNLMMYIQGHKILIQEDLTWERLKFKIDNRMKTNVECGVCYETSPTMICCQICANETCIACHLITTIEHFGETICPYCRVSNGEKKTKEKVTHYIMSAINIIKKDEYRDIVINKVNEYIKLKSNM